MAQSSRFPPPRLFHVNVANQAEEWKQWVQRLNIYMTATESTKKSNQVQVAILLTSIREEALRIHNTFVFAKEDNKNKLDAVDQKFADYFTPRSNVVFERY